MLSQIAKANFFKFIRDRRVFVIIALFLFIGLITTVIVGFLAERYKYTAVPPTSEYVPQELLINYHEGFAPHELTQKEREKLDSALSELGVVSQIKAYEGEEGPLSRYYLLTFRGDLDIRVLQKSLSRIKGIEVSQPNFIAQPFLTPNDPMYPQLWGIQKINSPTAWDKTTGSTGIIVAVLDTGIAGHPDLSESIVNPYNAINGGTTVADSIGHGTHVAGTVGAIGNNGVGVVGVNWNVKIMPIQVCSSAGCSNLSVTRGIQRAADSGAKVINMSLGTPAPYQEPCNSSHIFYSAIQYAISKGVTIVVAAGNDSRDASVVSPASCPGVITVGATTPSDGRASFSNFGSVVDIAAPGFQILSTWPGGYNTINGTSMASPMVAGAAALLLSTNPGLSPQEVRNCLVTNGDNIPSSSSIGPRLNIGNSINNCIGSAGIPTPTPTTALNPTSTTSPSRYYISGIVFEDNNNDREFNTGDLPLVNENIALSGSLTDTAATLTDGTFIFDNLFEGTFNVTYKGTGFNGINLTQTQPAVELKFIVTKDVANPTPTIVAGPTSIPITPTPTSTSPTSTPRQGGASTPTPTPTPAVYYKCEYDPACVSGQKNIQLCPLVCTQI